jgi:exodeoxyribonuclease III
MKIATFNINNIRQRLPNLLDWMRVTSPDVVCLQELKATGAEFPVAAIRDVGYEAIWRGQKTWIGVAILSRRKPIQTLGDLPGDPDDKQSRYIEAAVNGIVVASLYAPNGNPQPGPRFDYKLAWLRRLSVHAAELLATRVPVVLAGDYNVVPTAQDIYPSKSWDKDALVQPASRAAFAELTKQGWVDAVRALHPTDSMFTFWHYLRNRWQRNAGLRIDHVLLSPAIADRLQAAGVDREVRGQPSASDHAPVWVELSDESEKRERLVAKGKSSASPQSPGRVGSAPSGPRSSRPLLVIDGDSFAHRSYHALPKTIRRKDGKGGGAIVGFANFLLRLYESEQPRAMVVGWDTLEVPTERHKKFPAYQSGREFEDELLDRLGILPEFVAACGFKNAKAPGYEADDFLAAAVAAEGRRHGTVLVASGDRDTFQLASDTTAIVYPVRAGEMARIGPAEVRDRYGVDPGQVPDFIALRGDPSDKLPGARGVGPKGAADLLKRYGTLHEILAAGLFPTQADDLRLFRSIATMNRKAPLPSLAAQKPTWTKAADLARTWRLNQLADRLACLQTEGRPG